MKNSLSSIAVVLLIVTIIGLGLWYNVAVWNECRATNSFFYCMKLMSR